MTLQCPMDLPLVEGRCLNSYNSTFNSNQVDLGDVYQVRNCSLNRQDDEPDGISPTGKTLRLMI